MLMKLTLGLELLSGRHRADHAHGPEGPRGHELRARLRQVTHQGTRSIGTSGQIFYNNFILFLPSISLNILQLKKRMFITNLQRFKHEGTAKFWIKLLLDIN